MKEFTVDLTPTWESAMRIFVTSLTEGTPDKESVASTAREIIRGGQMLDQLIEERKEMLEALEDKESFQSLIKSLHMLREVSIEIGPITERDNVVLRPEDRIEIQPTFELACRIANTSAKTVSALRVALML